MQCGVIRLSDSVSDFWIESLGSDEMLDIANYTGDNDGAQTIFWRDEILTAAPTALHYMQY